VGAMARGRDPSAPGAERRKGADRENPGRNPRVLRVVVADANRLIISGIRRALEDDDEIEIVGEVYNGADVLPLVDETRPDVVLLDVRLSNPDGRRCLEQIRERHPDVKIVMLSVQSDPERIQAALLRGASGYIVKTINPRDIPAALRQAVEGSVYHAVGLTESAVETEVRTAGLTERELTILRAVARGLSNPAIGRELCVTEQTVKFHLTNIYRKLGVRNRTEAARYAYGHNLARPDSE